MSEHLHQKALIDWCAVFGTREPRLALLYAIPNGGLRSKATAGKLKAEGVRSGVPDLCLPVAARSYFGLYIEMKADHGRMTKEQDWWHEQLTKQGYHVRMCVGWDAARQTIQWYLGYKPT